MDLSGEKSKTIWGLFIVGHISISISQLETSNFLKFLFLIITSNIIHCCHLEIEFIYNKSKFFSQEYIAESVFTLFCQHLLFTIQIAKQIIQNLWILWRTTEKQKCEYFKMKKERVNQILSLGKEEEPLENVFLMLK